MYHWQKNLDAIEPPAELCYRGLVFPRWMGHLTRDEIRSGQTYFAFWGCTKLTARAIRYYVDRMIEKGEYEAA